EKRRDTRVALLVQRMAIARNGATRAAIFGHHFLRRLRVLHTLVGGALAYRFEEYAAGFRSAQNDRATTENAGGDGALQSVGCRREGHAACLHAGHQAVLRDGDQRCIEYHAGRLAGALAGHEQIEVISEGDLTDELLGQVFAAHHDGVGVGRADGGAGNGFLADFHVIPVDTLLLAARCVAFNGDTEVVAYRRQPAKVRVRLPGRPVGGSNRVVRRLDGRQDRDPPPSWRFRA